ncbi:cytolysin immunity CylI domain protein, partial [Bacillus cereus group sp. N12]|nr:cytolysin immunity CylI domain protein [Bacillus cereus group sp. N12]
ELESAEKSGMGYLQVEREWFEQLQARVSYDG